MSELPRVLVMELGSQYTLLIERTLRELGVRSAILSPRQAESFISTNSLDLIILSGGHQSVYDEDAPEIPHDVLKLRRSRGVLVPVLGICYGMQWMAMERGGRVERSKPEFGPEIIDVDELGELFQGTPKRQRVWMSHGDSVVRVPRGFRVLARSESGLVAAMQNKHMLGVQFHPEVPHSEWGKTILRNVLQFAGCKPDWQPTSIVDEIRGKAEDTLSGQKVLLGYSGGVDSTTVATVLTPVFGERLLPVVIDGGNLRAYDPEEIAVNAKAAGIAPRVVYAEPAFQHELLRITDAERKRRKFKEVYREILGREGATFGASVLIQGTLAPDKIESGVTGGDTIKSHHNVGLVIPGLTQWHPFENLFKYEVRAIAEALGLPPCVYNRQPFPGPGLFIRVVGVPATPRTLEICRWADDEVRKVLTRHGVYERISQLVVALIGTKTVGVKGDGRSYAYPVVVRAVQTIDFMTADGVHFAEEVAQACTKAVTVHPDINRVWFDPTPKPPGTTEME